VTVQEYTPEEEAAIVAKLDEVGEVVDVSPLLPATIEPGTLALASMSDQEFANRLVMLKAGRVRIATIQRELLRPGVDYGVIPGTAKPTLLKPGAEKLCDFYRFAADFTPSIEYGDGETTPAIRVLVRATLHLGSLDAPVVAVGYGEANSWEKRYRYRKGGLTCPKCGAVGSLTAQPTSRGSHWCIPDKGGCGENVSVEDAAGAERVDQVENPDPYELANTLVKMGEKRAHIDATLRATATSGLFTQDIEDDGPQGRPTSDPTPTATGATGSSGEVDDGLPGMRSSSGGSSGDECPVHHKPWKLTSSSRGSFWSCKTKVGERWCQERPSAAWAARHEAE
jgi:hypothetical protein